MPRTAPRLYLYGIWDRGSAIQLDPERSHYLSAVLRAQPGMEIRLFNGALGEWSATISAVHKRALTVEIAEQVKAPEPEPEQWLLFAPIKKAQLEWLIEKATELGVTRFLPVVTERTQLRTLNLERLQSIATEAAEQCERLSVPGFAPLQPLPTLLSQWPTERPLHVALERYSVQQSQLDNLATVMIGPEGGFSDAEQTLLHRQSFVRPISLGSGILRAETAAITALGWSLLLRQKSA